MERNCSQTYVEAFKDTVNKQLWRSNGLMIGIAALVAITVVVSTFGWRYRHATVTRFLFLATSTLYLPIVSYLVSSVGRARNYNNSSPDLGVVWCEQPDKQLLLLLLWTVLVQIVGINFSEIVAVNDGDGQKLGQWIELLARALWTSYLVFYNIDLYNLDPDAKVLIALCVLYVVKVILKFYTFEKARRSFALGRNARLIAGYMEQLYSQPPAAEPISALIVMGEEKQQIEEGPKGYIINQEMINNSLVTVDRVWRFASTRDVSLARRPQLKDLCLSFALFKLLRRRFAKCNLAESGSAKAFNFVRYVLLNDAGGPDRAFRVIADQVSFLGDSYYSSLPASNIGKLLPVLNVILSLSIIITCGRAVSANSESVRTYPPAYIPRAQLECYAFDCVSQGILFGSILFNYVPAMFLIVTAILAEAWEIVSYICSNWMKVTLICSYVTHTSWQAPRVPRWLDLALKLRIKCIKNFSDHMGQISLLPHQQATTCGKLPCFSSQGKLQHVKTPTEVKAAIVGALRSSNGSLSNGMAALQSSRIGNRVLWALHGEGTSDVMLIWHIATGIFEARHAAASPTSADDRTVATYLSRYCVYLMEAAPELLPDDKAWTKKQCKAVRKCLDQLLSAWRSHGDSGNYEQMIQLMREGSDQHKVVEKGVRLGEQLVAAAGHNTEAGWGVLASLWSETILYAAPTDNLRAHKETIARGGELMTLIWALLTNAGIINRPSVRTAV